jgi:hypothetical protein
MNRNIINPIVDNLTKKIIRKNNIPIPTFVRVATEVPHVILKKQ